MKSPIIFILFTLIAISSCKRDLTQIKFDAFENSVHWYEKGNELLENQQYIDALKAFNTAIEFNAHNSKIWYNKGVTFEALGKIQESINSYDRAILLSYDYQDVRLRSLTNKCNSLMILGQYKRALKTCNKAIKTKDDYISAIYNKGVVLYKMNKKKLSLIAHKKVISIDSNYLNSWIYLAIIYNYYNNFDEEYKANKRITELDSSNSKAWYSQAIYLSSKEKYELSEAAINKYVGLVPNSFEGWYLRGTVNEILNNTESAVQSYEKALEFNILSEETLFYLGDYYLENESYEKAWNFANKILIYDSSNVIALTIKATVHWRKKEFDEAEKYLLDIEKIKETGSN